MLRERLVRRGLTLSAALFAGALVEHSAAAAVPATLVEGTVKAAMLSSAGKTLAGVVSPNVIALAESTVRAMFLTRLTTATILVLATGLTIGGSAWAYRALTSTPAADPPPLASAAQPVTPPVLEADDLPVDDVPADLTKAGGTIAGNLATVDLAQGKVGIRTFSRLEGPSVHSLALAKGAVVQRNGKATRLEDLRIGSRVVVRLSADRQSVLAISATGPTIPVQLKSMDPDRNTLTAIVEAGRPGKQERVFPLADDVKVTIDGKDARLSDLSEGASLLLTLSDDGNTVHQVQTPSRRNRSTRE